MVTSTLCSSSCEFLLRCVFCALTTPTMPEWQYFMVTTMLSIFIWKCYGLIRLSWNFVWWLITSTGSWVQIFVGVVHRAIDLAIFLVQSVENEALTQDWPWLISWLRHHVELGILVLFMILYAVESMVEPHQRATKVDQDQRSKTHKRLKERFLNRRNRTKRSFNL